MNNTLVLTDWKLSIPTRWRQVDSAQELAEFLQNKAGIKTVDVDNAPLTINGKTRHDPEWNNAVELRLQNLVKEFLAMLKQNKNVKNKTRMQIRSR